MTVTTIDQSAARAARRRHRPLPLGLIGRYVALILTVVVTAFPLVWLFLTSIRTSADIFAVPVHLIPTSATGAQYAAVFGQYDTASYLWNTVVVSLVTVVCLLIGDILYAVADPRITYS